MDYRGDAFENQPVLGQAGTGSSAESYCDLSRCWVQILCDTADDGRTLSVSSSRTASSSPGHKNADSYRIMPFVEFKPFALINGRASFGYRHVTFIRSGAPDFSGPVGNIDLAYTLLGRTVFSVNARRDLEFSLYNDQNYLIGIDRWRDQRTV